MMLDISDQAHRVLTAIIANTNMVADDPEYQTTYVGQDWIAFHIGKDQKAVSKYIRELVAVGIMSVERRGHNITNLMRVNTKLILELGSMRHAQSLADLKATQVEKSEERRSRTSGSATPNLPSPAGVNLPSPATPNLGGDLVSLNLVSHDHGELTVALPSATQPSNATARAYGSLPHGSRATATTPSKPQGPRSFTDDQIGAWESLEAKLLSRLEALRIDGHTTSE